MGLSQLQMAAAARAPAKIQTVAFALSALVQITWESLSNVADYVRATMMEIKSLKQHLQGAEIAGWIGRNDREAERRRVTRPLWVYVQHSRAERDAR